MSTSCLSINNNNNNNKIFDFEQQSTRICYKKKKPLSSLSPSPISLTRLKQFQQEVTTTTTTTTTTTATTTSQSPQNQQIYENERSNLIEKLNENHKFILEARNEYIKEYKNFINIAFKFYDEKYLNLKLKFKNEILKQQIYFESELYDISKECKRDYEYQMNKFNNTTTSNRKSKLNIKLVAENYLKLCKIDMKKLIEYMKESLINSYETLIEAYETCHVLKLIEKLFKQNNNNYLQLMNTNNKSLNFIQKYLNDDKMITSDSRSSSSSSSCDTSDDSDDSSCSDDNNNQNNRYLNEEMQIIKYKQEMESLMNTLDDIEVQYLHRKDQMQKKNSKLIYQLKSKIKYIENKYDCLSKEVNNLKYEKCVYKNLLDEKINNVINTNTSSGDLVCVDKKQIKDEYINCDRKLNLITNLIDFHKNKNINNSNSNTNSNSSNNNKRKQIIKSNNDQTKLQLYECNCDGDLVTIENCNLKNDHDLSDWIITRQIDNMPMRSYKIPFGALCKSGKVITIKTSFNDQNDFLYAIKKYFDNNNNNNTNTNKKNFSLRIHTKLISPNGKIVSSHIQEIPQFYQEIFKYANLIGFY